MKKWIAMMAAGVMAFSLAGCGAGDVGGSEYMASKDASSQQASSSAEASSKPEVVYDDSMQGLQKYLADRGIVSGDAVKMEASLIGAKEGVRYMYGYEGKENVSVELYEYDSANLDETAQKVLSSVKESGKFTIMEREVPGVLSADEKYMMIYIDTQDGEAHTKRTEEAKTIFLNFQK